MGGFFWWRDLVFCGVYGAWQFIGIMLTARNATDHFGETSAAAKEPALEVTGEPFNTAGYVNHRRVISIKSSSYPRTCLLL